MKNTVFTVITAVLLLATLCLTVFGARVREKVCVELEGNGDKPIRAVNAESLHVANDYDTIVSADTRDGVVYLSLIGGSQPRPNACGLTPKNPRAEWTGWGGPLDTDNATVGEGPGFRNKIVTGGYYFARGLGAHAVSTLVYDLSGDTYTRFEGWIGMSDEKDPGNRFCDDGGSSTFTFLLDGREVRRPLTLQGIIDREVNPRPVKVAFDIPSTARELKIVMGDGGDGINCDHPVIGDAKLLTSRVTGDGPAPVTVASLNQQPVQPPTVQAQEPVWEFQQSLKPHPDTAGSSYPIEDIGFYGNSQVIFGRAHRIYNWNLSTGRYRARIYDVHDLTRQVNHVEVSETHDIVAHTFGSGLYLRRASDLSFIDFAGLPGHFPDTLSIEPRTNYVIVSGDSSTAYHTRYTRLYDLWENNSWGLNLRHDYQAGDKGYATRHVDILNYDYAYVVRRTGQSVRELSYRDREPWNLSFEGRHNETYVAVAAGQTSIGVRIAGITNQHQLVVWDWFANRLYSKQLSSNGRYPRSFQFTPNREILTWINGPVIVFWDVTTEKVDAEVSVPGIPTCHAFSKDGKTMAVGMGGGSVRIYKWSGASALAAPAKETERSQPTALLSNYPNPFNPETWIPYQLSDPAEVTVSIYSVDGKLVRTLELGQMPAGVYSDKDRAAYWDGRNAQGEPVASGVYFYTLTAGDFKATRKMVIRK